MIGQIVTLVGVLVGALTSYLAATTAERTRHRRTMATRWDERKLDTYIEYASCVKEIHAAAKRALQAEQGTDTHREFLTAMEEAERKRSVLFETLILLAAPAAIEAANAVNRVLWKIEIATRDHDTTPVEGDLMALLTAYHAQARLDLGIPHTEAWPF
ncbi:hypothetical protein [Streptomyces hesseae]|uniref:Secreted protein n=1 Tax=Streptomyces hesseae TaxID=3075519 RepID=A0ABU2SLW9_9ACTN|nr:hypothetical protein [Streptomyces sp. DSM 40473]MDT0448874.1 hypothetical protein [Streptomyces sp. DSM 40473]